MNQHKLRICDLDKTFQPCLVGFVKTKWVNVEQKQHQNRNTSYWRTILPTNQMDKQNTIVIDDSILFYRT